MLSGIFNVVSKYEQFINFWAVLDDLPLASAHSVCVPSMTDLNTIIHQLTNIYFILLVCLHSQPQNAISITISTGAASGSSFLV